jgi:endonuclease/exonuclease/phosphatase family metal-dependent hydrolase
MDDVGEALTVATYNVHRCIGVDGRHDPARVAGVLRELDADLIGLQEVASRCGQAGDVDQLAFFAQETGHAAVAAPTLTLARGECGNALLSRLPIRSVRRLDLSLPRREPRGALDVEVERNGQPVRVIVTHLGLRVSDRLTQVGRLLELLGTDTDGSVVILADVNEWLPAAPALRWLHARLGPSRAVRTFPSWRPLFALDRIWAQPFATLRAVERLVTPLTRVASDHLPVRATLSP